MTQHIEEARKLEPCGWLVKPKWSAKVCTFFDHEPHFGGCENWDREDYEVNPLYDAAALAAAEERGRIEERERCAKLYGSMKLFGHWSKHRLSDGVFLPLVCYVPEGPDYTSVPLYAITKEPTP